MQFEVPSKKSERLRKSVIRLMLGSVALSSLFIYSDEFHHQFEKRYHEFLDAVGNPPVLNHSPEETNDNALTSFETIRNSAANTNGLEQLLETSQLLYDNLKDSPNDHTVLSEAINHCLPGNMVPSEWQQRLTLKTRGNEVAFRPASFLNDGEDIIACGYVYPDSQEAHTNTMFIAVTRIENIVEDVGLVECSDYLVTTGNTQTDYELLAGIPVSACSA